MGSLVLDETKLQVIKYACVGLANTALTATVIFGLMQAGVGVYPSNASGYITGIIFSFVMNAKFTFSTSLSSMRFIKFLSACAICYILNIMKAFLIIMPEKLYTAQVIGMFFYTSTGFILNKFWSMK